MIVKKNQKIPIQLCRVIGDLAFIFYIVHQFASTPSTPNRNSIARCFVKRWAMNSFSMGNELYFFGQRFSDGWAMFFRLLRAGMIGV